MLPVVALRQGFTLSFYLQQVVSEWTCFKVKHNNIISIAFISLYLVHTLCIWYSGSNDIDQAIAVPVGLAVGVLIVLAVIIATTTLVTRHRRHLKNNRKHMTKPADNVSVIANHAHNDYASTANPVSSRGLGLYASLVSEHNAWSKIDPNLRLTLQHSMLAYERLTIGDVIDKGQFGLVYAASLKQAADTGDLKVAVKTLRSKIL